jgi:hypothetical protein
MHSLKKSLLALAGILVLVGVIPTLLPLVGQAEGQGKGGKQGGANTFYLTTNEYTGGQALSACNEGYHMASLWEILDVSNLSYDKQLGFAQDDSGSGPPNAMQGWVRTGYDAHSAGLTPGADNCNAYLSSDSSEFGTQVYLSRLWTVPPTMISPWIANSAQCDWSSRVWCVRD